jgi:hypothetical protein
MNQSSPMVLKDPYFNLALGFAKGAAKFTKAKELSPLLMLAGFNLAQRFSKAGPPPAILENSEAIARSLSYLGLGTGVEIAPDKKTSLPLSQELQKILASSGSDLKLLIAALLKTIKCLEAINEDTFKLVLTYASSLAIQAGLATITPECFTAAAFAVFKEGHLKNRPTLSANIAVNKTFFEALTAEKGWEAEVLYSGRSATLPLGPELQEAIENAEPESNLLVAAVNVGLKIGAKLFSKKITAYHEAGHAVVSSILRPELPISQVSIIAKDDYEGVTRFDTSSPYDDRLTRDNFLEIICIYLAGREAQNEQFGYGEIDTGASSDLQEATRMAWNAIAEYGLDAEFGPISLTTLSKASGQTGGWLFDRAHQRLQQVMKEASERARDILRSNWPQVEAVAAALIKKKQLGDDDFMTSLVQTGLASWPGVRRVCSLPVERNVTFARTSGVHQTREGPVRYDAEDALVAGPDGKDWPVNRKTFERIYAPVDSNGYGQDGRYRKIGAEILAVRLDGPRRIDLSGGRGVLTGQSGDWLVDYGAGDLAIIAADVFLSSYKLDPS